MYKGKRGGEGMGSWRERTRIGEKEGERERDE